MTEVEQRPARVPGRIVVIVVGAFILVSSLSLIVVQKTKGQRMMQVNRDAGAADTRR